MAEQIVTVEIDKNGDFSTSLNGFKGKGCKAVADIFSKIGKVVKEELKPEYYEGGEGSNSHLNTSR